MVAAAILDFKNSHILLADKVIKIGHRYHDISFFTARCPIVQSAVLRSYVVYLSVCDVGGS